MGEYREPPLVQTVAEAEAQQLEMPERFEDWQFFALLMNGYSIAKELGMAEYADWSWEQLDRYDQSGEWHTNTLGLRLILFFYQRYFHHSGEPVYLQDFHRIDSLLHTIAERRGLDYQTDVEARARFRMKEGLPPVSLDEYMEQQKGDD